MRQWAEQELVIPSGRFEGRRFRVDRQPLAGLLLDAFDSGRWRRSAVTGPRQSGKTLFGSCVPVMYHLFEIGETVVYLVPSMLMAGDKWREDLLPAINASRYRDLLPSTGKGSKGGEVESIEFRNGATLKFMSGGGDDKKRAGFTSRVLVATEVDALDQSGGTSHEADKLTQAIYVTESFGEQARIYLECTVTIDTGRTWREYTGGTESKIVLRCAHCGDWVTPERDQLMGWQEAETVVEARERAHLVCPGCGSVWSENDRNAAQQNGKLLHRCQSIDPDGVISGEAPATETLGFRWTAANNLFLTMGDLGVREWNALRDPDQENAEKEMRQFVWAMPFEPPQVDLSNVSIQGIQAAVSAHTQGVVPAETKVMTVGIDLGKRLAHWACLGFDGWGSVDVIDYGRQEVASDELGEVRALVQALRELRDRCMEGWQGGGAGIVQPRAVFIDSGWYPEAVHLFVGECNAHPQWRNRFFATKGYGINQARHSGYNQPKAKSDNVRLIGEGYHIARVERDGGHKSMLVEISADVWKSWLHERIRTPAGEPGSFRLYQPEAGSGNHLAFARHLTAEKQIEDNSDRTKGRILKWVQESPNNHFLDATSLACCAAHLAGVRIVRGEAAPRKSKQARVKPRNSWLEGGG